MDEPWDEIMGPPPSVSLAPTTAHRTPPRDPPPAPPIRVVTPGAPPPAAMFRTSSNSTTSAVFTGLPQQQQQQHWSQQEADEEDSRAATTQAVYMASNAALSRTESVSGSSFADDDMAVTAVDPEDANGRYTQHFMAGTGRSMDVSEDEDEKSVDSAIGREYDSRDHDHIRQEALRMLEVADADSHYSVHRTITGGFTAQPKQIGNQRRTRTALQGLNFIATSRVNNGNNRFSNFTTTEYASPSGKSSSDAQREDFEYGDVVDIIGLENRSASTAASADGQGINSNWSSRYSIDRTMLAMSGGSMKNKLDRMDRENNIDRFTASNLFRNSPAKSPQIFGSGFSFRQDHVFGKQKVTMPTDNIQPVWNDTTEGSPQRAKTWQEQILQKKQQQRRWLICICLFLVCIIVPLASVLSVRRSRSVESSTTTSSNDNNNAAKVDNDRDSVTFHVTSDSPHNDAQEQKLKKDLAAIAVTSSFVVHLGNVQDSALTNCTRDAYDKVAALLENNSPSRVFVVPGEEDWNNCPDPNEAWNSWYENFIVFDDRWNDMPGADQFSMYRENLQLENWAFSHEGVLFLGVHLVNGEVPDEDEFSLRNNLNYEWVMGMTQDHHKLVRAVVIFGNAKPEEGTNTDFFAPIQEFWKDTEFSKPTLYVHPSSDKTSQYRPFKNLPHVTVAQVKYDIKTAPRQIKVGFGEKPFSFA